MELFFSRLSSLMMALLLALGVWLYVNSLQNPLVTRDLTQRIPLTVRGLDATLQPLSDLRGETVRLTVRAPLNAWNDLGEDDFAPYIDLTGLSTGVHDVSVKVDFANLQAEVLGVQPPNLRIQLEQLIAKTVTVRVQVMDAAAYGYEWKEPLIDPITVTINGPATQVEMVTEAVARVELANAKQQVEVRQAIELINRQRQVVPNVVAEPNAVNVVVPVEQWPGRKEVAVRLDLRGEPAFGYRLSTVVVSPTTVVLQGNNELLTSVPGFVETEPLTLAGATTDIEQQLKLLVPAGLSVLDGNLVQAQVTIAAKEDSRTIKLRPVTQNIGDGLEAKIAEDATVDVILSGPIVMLNSLNIDDIYAVLDLTGLVAGSHVVVPNVVLPQGLTAEGVLPQTVEVVISAQSAPTPEPPQ